jgi:hypothetical protein
MYFGSILQQQHTRAWQANVWDANFMAVWHFSKNNALCYTDSTANQNDLVQWPGNANKTAQVTQSGIALPCGQFGCYIGYQGVLSANDSPSLEITGSYLMEESWIHPLSTTPASEWMGKLTPQANTNGYYMEYLNTEGLGCEFGFFNDGSYYNNPRVNTTTAIPLNVWTYIVGMLNNGSVNGEAGILCYYNASVQPGTYPYQTGSDIVSADNSPFLIGYNTGGNSFNYGSIGEMRLSNIARSSAYMNYVYNQLSVANAGLSLGAIQLV